MSLSDIDGKAKTVGTLPAPGTVVGGKYLLERFIAEGGMGVIALGRHVELEEPIALKFL
jgi:serine/threonine-protein kinase